MDTGDLFFVSAPLKHNTVITDEEEAGISNGQALTRGDFVIFLERKVLFNEEDRSLVVSRLGVGWVFTEDLKPCMP